MSDATAAIRIDIIASGAEAGARRVNTALDSIGRKGKATASANDNVAGSFERVSKALTGTATHGSKFNAVLENIKGRAASAAPEIANLTGTIARMGPMAAVVGGIALAIGAISAKAIDAARRQELWLANLQTVTGDATKAKESYAALVNFAAKTPFDLGQSVEGFIKLRTLGLQATEGALMSFGNTAAAMGKPLNQMIEAVADAATGEFERLKEFGIKSKTQGDMVAFTFGGVTTKVKNNAQEIQKYLENLGNTKFGGAMARQMDTINGAASNLEDAIFQAFAAIGSGQLGNSFKEILKTVAAGVSAATPMFASLGNVIGSIVGAVGSVLNALGNLWLNLHGGASAGTDILTGLTVTFNLVAQGVTVFGNIVAAVFGAFSGIVSGVMQLFSDGFTTLLNWMGVSFESGGRSWSNSIVGVLRAVKVVVSLMPQLFSVAINDVMKMFRSLGSIVGRLLSGDLSALKDIGGAITGSFGNTAKAMNAASRIVAATYRDVKGADAAITRLTGANTTKAKLDTGALVKPSPTDKKGDKKDKGESEAEKRAKQEAEFWKTLQGEVETAKLLPLAAEDHRKELELQKILGRDLIAGEKTRIGSLMQEARTAKFVTAALDTHNKAARDNANEQEMFAKRLAGMTAEQGEIENKMLTFRNNAQDTGVDLQSQSYKLAEAQLRLDEQGAAAIKKKNDQLATALNLARDYSTAFQKAEQAKTNSDNLAALNTAYNGGNNGLGITPEVYKQITDGMSRAAKETSINMKADFGQRISELGDEISGKWGDAIGKLGKVIEGIAAAARGDFSGLGAIGGILNVLGHKQDGSLNKVGDEASKAASGALDKLFSKGTLTDPLKSLSSGFGDFKGDLKNLFGKGGDFQKGLGSVLGKAGMGASIGEATASIANAIGIKLNKTGSQIGGALGGAVLGPLGAIGGSVLGGLVGGLFSKPKYGTASLTGGDAVVSGRGSAQKAAASGAAGSVQQGLADLAAQLGGMVGNYSVAIGQYDGKWRVRDDAYGGALKFKGSAKNGLHDFGKDGEAAAIAYAIENAIKDGAITGLSPIIQKALNGLGADAAIQFAKDWTAAMQDYTSLIDPMGAAVDAVITPLKALKDTMTKIGASSEDMAKFEDYRAKKLDAVLKEQTSSFRDILDQLNGSAGGVTALTQLTNNLSALDKFKADIAAGKTVDQSTFADLANKIIGGAGDVYGANTSQYQDIVSLLKDVTSGALTNATNSFNAAAGYTTVVNTDSTTAAINAQTDQVTAALNLNADYLAQIAASLENAQFSGLPSYKVGSMNGSLLLAY